MKKMIARPSGPGKYIIIGPNGRPILFRESIPTGGGPEPGPLVDIRALANVYSVVPPTAPEHDIYFTTGSDTIYPSGFEIEHPVTNERQRFYIETVPSASDYDLFILNVQHPETTAWASDLQSVVWSSYHNKWFGYGATNNEAYPSVYSSLNGKKWIPENSINIFGTTGRRIFVNPTSGQMVSLGSRGTNILYFSSDFTTAGTGSITGSRGPETNMIGWSPDLNRYVAVGTSDGGSSNPARAFLYSDNGINWMTGSQAAYTYGFPNLNSVIWSTTSSLYVASARAQTNTSPAYTIGGIFTSPDGITWTQRNAISQSTNIGAVGYIGYFGVNELNGKFVAHAMINLDPPVLYVATSSNAIDWYKIEIPNSSSLLDTNYTRAHTVGFTTNNKFYVQSAGILNGSTNVFITSSDGVNWGTGSIPTGSNRTSGLTDTVESPTTVFMYDSFGITGVLDKNAPTFISRYYEDTEAIVKFNTSQSSDIYNTYLPWYQADGLWTFQTASGTFWTDFYMYLRDEDLSSNYYGDTVGEVGAGIIVSSSGYLADANTYDEGYEDATVDGVRYIQEYDTDTYGRAIYLEREIPDVTSMTYANATASISITAKSNGRRYMYLYGYFYENQNSTFSSEYGLIVDLVSGSITHYEDPTINSTNNTVFSIYGSDAATTYPHKFTTAPTITDAGDGFWTVSFNLSTRPLPGYNILRSGSIYFTSGSF